MNESLKIWKSSLAIGDSNFRINLDDCNSNI